MIWFLARHEWRVSSASRIVRLALAAFAIALLLASMIGTEPRRAGTDDDRGLRGTGGAGAGDPRRAARGRGGERAGVACAAAAGAARCARHRTG